ncbi:hypothetical protein [Novosphingobium sp. 9U]|uniref:hypothetical protein n=1 Tax=Novosphingobium sp. 9U TaxID=2653158 RepID=UPI001358E23D|nr:hypothetical protein [Novosphingobium sp. 9U]
MAGFWGLAHRFPFRTIHDVEMMLLRGRRGREASPSATLVESQSAKAPSTEERGFEAAKKVAGRKRHIVVERHRL